MTKLIYNFHHSIDGLFLAAVPFRIYQDIFVETGFVFTLLNGFGFSQSIHSTCIDIDNITDINEYSPCAASPSFITAVPYLQEDIIQAWQTHVNHIMAELNSRRSVNTFVLFYRLFIVRRFPRLKLSFVVGCCHCLLIWFHALVISAACTSVLNVIEWLGPDWIVLLGFSI